MYTSIVLLALGGSPLEVESLTVASLTWHSDYPAARRLAAEEKKPLAVFVGKGEEGFKKVSRSGELSGKTDKLLRERYVCVYLDRSEVEGKKRAESLAIRGSGLVLTRAGSKKPSFRHVGGLASKDLERYLVRYAEPVSTTKSSDGKSPSKPRRGIRRVMPSFMPRMGGAAGC